MQRFNSYIIRHLDDATPAKCPKCDQEKPMSEYYTHSIRGDGAIRYRPYCRKCRSNGSRKNWSRPVHSAIIAANTQNCRFCNIEKPLDAFYANGCFADGVKKYRSRCKQCVLLLSKQAYPKIYISKAIKRSSSPKNFISGILNHATKRKQHLIFDIDLMYLLQLYENQKGCCALSGVQMTYIAGNGKVNTNISIDRIDSSKGYSKGNVQFVCDIVNRMKQDLSEIDLLIWCKHIVKALK